MLVLYLRGCEKNCGVAGVSYSALQLSSALKKLATLGYYLCRFVTEK